MPLAPPLLELENTVQRAMARESLEPNAVVEQFGRVRDFLLESVGLFREVEDTLFVDEEGQQKLTLCSQEMEHSMHALDKLQEAVMDKKVFVLKERLESFLGSRNRCLEYFAEFSDKARQQPIYSPVPAYDAFIKAGIKVLEGQLDGGRLQERFPGLVAELQKAQRLVYLLPKLHDVPPELVEALDAGLQGLETGYGAVGQYLESGEKTALDDGLKLIGSSSTILGMQLEKAEQLVRSNPRYSKFRPLEELLRLKNYAREHPDEIPLPFVVVTLAQVFSVWDYLLHQSELLMTNPVLMDMEVEGGVAREDFEECLKHRVEARQTLAGLSGEEVIATDDDVWLAHSPALEKLAESVEKSHHALEAALLPFKELPGLERVVYLKADVKNGRADKTLLYQELEQQLQRVEELIDSVAGAQDPISREFYDLLPIHRGAFFGMMADLEEDNWEELEGRWQSVISTLPHLANLSRSIRQRLQAQSSSSRMIRCLRCQAMNNPDRRVCSTCGANLPAVVRQIQTFSEIDTEGPSAGPPPQTLSPRAIDLLESLVRGVEGNQTSKKDAADALQLLINDLNRQRQMFTKKLVPLMGKDNILDTYLRVFAQAINAYFSALMEMHTAVEEGSLARLHSGLAQSRETLEVLDLMKDRIDEALRG